MISAWWLLVTAFVSYIIGGVVGFAMACIPFSKAMRKARSEGGKRT